VLRRASARGHFDSSSAAQIAVAWLFCVGQFLSEGRRASSMDDSSRTADDEIGRIRKVYAERARMQRENDDNPGRQRLLRERSDIMEETLGKRFGCPLSECRVLDVGCGGGSLLGWLNERGVPSTNLFGIDLCTDRIEMARKSYPAFTFFEGSAEQLDFADNWFDLVLAFTVFSSIFDCEMAKRVARSIERVLAGHGAVLWHDMRYPNPWNRTIKAMTKRRIRTLFPSFELELKPIYLLPPIARRLGRFTNPAYPMLRAIPALRSHYFGLLRPHRYPDRSINLQFIRKLRR
jgi:SAM-dependent methyltransferase